MFTLLVFDLCFANISSVVIYIVIIMWGLTSNLAASLQ